MNKIYNFLLVVEKDLVHLALYTLLEEQLIKYWHI